MKMRKVASMLLASVMALSLTACGGSSGGTDSSDSTATGSEAARKNILRTWSGYLPNDVPGTETLSWLVK